MDPARSKPTFFSMCLTSFWKKEIYERYVFIDFNRIKGGKPFNYNADWFKSLLKKIEQ